MRVAILDDYQNAALRLGDWSDVRRHAEITVFNDHVADPAAVVERLRPFDVICVMRERTPLSREVLQKLPRLKMIASTGPRNASIDMQAAADRGILVTATVARFAPVRLVFAWTRADDVRLLLGQTNFFLEFDACFFRARLEFEVKPKSEK